MKSLENYKTLLDEDDIRRAVARLSHEIIESNQGIDDLILIGIETRGHYIASRIINLINDFENCSLSSYSIDPQFFRDDIVSNQKQNDIHLGINVENKNLVIVDDVLFTGRTIRATLEAIFTVGRPKNIKLANFANFANPNPLTPDPASPPARGLRRGLVSGRTVRSAVGLKPKPACSMA